jgi:hypothetical protein
MWQIIAPLALAARHRLLQLHRLSSSGTNHAHRMSELLFSYIQNNSHGQPMLSQETKTPRKDCRLYIALSASSIRVPRTFWGASYALLGFHVPAMNLAHEFVQAVKNMPLLHPAAHGIAGASLIARQHG